MMLLRAAKNLVKAVGSPVIDRFGIYQRRIDRLTAEPGAWTIVMYHRVIADAAADPFRLGMCVTRERFEQQIAYFRRHFSPIRLDEGVRRIARGEPLPAGALSITFDDGYLDNLTQALPVMQAHGMPSSLYVPTGGIDSGEMLWWDRVIAAVASTQVPQVDLADLGLVSSPERRLLTGWWRADSAIRILDLLWELPAPTQRNAVATIERQLAPRVPDVLVARRLNDSQVRQMHEKGVEIAAHTVDHPNLTLCSHEEVRHELQTSREHLESCIQDDVAGMAYPGGRMTDSTARIAAELGFRYAVATRPGYNLPPFDIFELRRVGMPDTGMSDFRRAVSRTLAGNRSVGTTPTF
jgi:peptidoglycan/xylan/chitin deacetylase (PgdA/CDA1 family)